jgi:hypothetical protein
MPRLSCKAFQLPKRGNTARELEDAYAEGAKHGRFAVADGATEASYALLWAHLLANALVEAPPAGELDEGWLAPLRHRWAEHVGGLALPWYAEEKRDQGAFATCLALHLRAEPRGVGGPWSAVAVGDTCLFHVREGALVERFPIQAPGDFNTRPPLVGSRPGPAPTLARTEGEWWPGDVFLLMTDALAEWFLRQDRAGGAAWERAVGEACAQTPRNFPGWVEGLRDREGLRNDDVTLLTVRT